MTSFLADSFPFFWILPNGAVTPLVKRLPGKHKDLAWIPGTHIKESAYVMGACNLSAEEAEVGGAQGLPGPAV